MESVIILDKKIGETPLECLERFRRDHLEYQSVKMTYAGRLDPMASGVLVVLAGDMVHRKEEFLGMEKMYEAVIVVGLGTDTFDGLGVVGEVGDRVAGGGGGPPPPRHPKPSVTPSSHS